MTEEAQLKAEKNIAPCDRRRSWHSLILGICAWSSLLGNQPPASSATSPPGRASSEIRQESNGRWLFIDGVRTPAFAGMVYQNTAGAMHISGYTNSLHSLYSGLGEEGAGGYGHGARLAQLG